MQSIPMDAIVNTENNRHYNLHLTLYLEVRLELGHILSVPHTKKQRLYNIQYYISGCMSGYCLSSETRFSVWFISIFYNNKTVSLEMHRSFCDVEEFKQFFPIFHLFKTHFF